MNNTEYTLLKMIHNGFVFWAHGNTPIEAENCLFHRVKTVLIGADMFSKTSIIADPEHFKMVAKNAINEASATGNKKSFNLSGMTGVLERKINISKAVSKNIDSDTLRGWVYLWTSSLRNSTGFGIESRTPDDLRWLITDNGFFIDKNNPSENPAKTNDEKRLLAEEFQKHIFIAKKFGASTLVINELSNIEKNLTAQINESTGDFSHMSLEELNEKLENIIALENFSKRNGNQFIISGPTAALLKEAIEKRNVK